MTMLLHQIRALAIAIAVLFSNALTAWANCPPTPEKYRDLEFGDVRFAIEEDCRRAFTQNEQFFIAGIAQSLRTKCMLPRDVDGRALVEQFTKAATLSFELTKARGALHDRVPAESGREAAFDAGKSMMDDIRCNGPEAALLARGIFIYLRRTSGSSRFVEGCVERYSGRYGVQECRCIADSVRAVLPDVDRRFFDRELVKESIHHAPSTALKLMISCGVGSY